MAAPHVAGAAALLASLNNPNNAADVAAIRNQIVNSGTSVAPAKVTRMGLFLI
jgi:subtilisin family serine protease